MTSCGHCDPRRRTWQRWVSRPLGGSGGQSSFSHVTAGAKPRLGCECLGAVWGPLSEAIFLSESRPKAKPLISDREELPPCSSLKMVMVQVPSISVMGEVSFLPPSFSFFVFPLGGHPPLKS